MPTNLKRSAKRSVGLWSLLVAVGVPIACSSEECDGPGGLCITPPGGEAGTGAGGEGAETGEAGNGVGGARSGAAGSGSGRAGSDGGDGGDAGAPDATGGVGGRGGTSPLGGTAGVFVGGTGGAIGATGGTGGQGLCRPPGEFPNTCGKGGGGGSGEGGEAGSTDPCGLGLGEAGMGGASGGTGGVGASGGAAMGGLGGKAGAGGKGGAAGVGGAPNRILFPLDDLEDGDALTNPVFNGRGAWWGSNDGSGMQFPTPTCMISSPIPGGTTANARAMRTYGAGFHAPVTGSWAIIGVALRYQSPECHRPLDASMATGVYFRARAEGQTQTVRFGVQTTATNSFDNDGFCASLCYDSHGVMLEVDATWRQYVVPFSTLRQEGWGMPAYFDPRQVLDLAWNARRVEGGAPECFDFSIDDVGFYRDE